MNKKMNNFFLASAATIITGTIVSENSLKKTRKTINVLNNIQRNQNIKTTHGNLQINKNNVFSNPIETWKKNLIDLKLEKYNKSQETNGRASKIIPKPKISWIYQRNGRIIEKKAPIWIKKINNKTNCIIKIKDFDAKNFLISIDNQSQIPETKIKAVGSNIIIEGYSRCMLACQACNNRRAL